jgi:hypothetical protein
VLLFSGGCDGGIEVINPGDHGQPGEAEVRFAGNWQVF